VVSKRGSTQKNGTCGKIKRKVKADIQKGEGCIPKKGRKKKKIGRQYPKAAWTSPEKGSNGLK